MEPIADGVWTEARRLRFAGVETGTRMTVVRLSDGGLFVHSPIPLRGGTREAVDALGPVKAVVAPSLFHHLSVGAWIQAYPDAVVCACPGLERKRRDLAWQRVLGDEPEKEWRGEIDQVFFGARSLENEVVFFHRASRTLICADMIFNLAHHPSRFTRIVAFLASGEMAFAYFMVHAPNGPLPIMNHGELAALYSFLFLFLAAHGGGPFSLDATTRKRRRA